MYTSKKYQAGIAMPVVIVVVVILLGLGVGGYLYFSKPTTEQSIKQEEPAVGSSAVPTQTQPQSKTPEKPMPSAFLGEWKVEKVFGLNAQGQWSETATSPYKPTYIAFGSGSFCVTEATDLKCDSFTTYQVNGNIISSPGAAAGRFIWEMTGEKLELIYSERVNDSWTPLVRFISVKIK